MSRYADFPITMLSVVIPAYDEAGSIASTVEDIAAALEAAAIDYEIVVIDDASSDETAIVLDDHRRENPPSPLPPLAQSAGSATPYEPASIVSGRLGGDRHGGRIRRPSGYRPLPPGPRGGLRLRVRLAVHSWLYVHDYPRFKLFLNRIVNCGIRVLFRSGYNDTTNAFKAYRREVIETVQPLLSNHFNLTVEIPLKAIVRGHSYKVIPISWRNRKEGESKLSLQEMGSRYAFIVLYVLLERHLSRGDYRRPEPASTETHPVRAHRKRSARR